MKLDEQISRIKSIITELSPNSVGVDELLATVKDTPGLLKHLGFKNYKSLEEYISDGSYKDFTELKKDVDKFIKKKH